MSSESLFLWAIQKSFNEHPVPRFIQWRREMIGECMKSIIKMWPNKVGTRGVIEDKGREVWFQDKQYYPRFIGSAGGVVFSTDNVHVFNYWNLRGHLSVKTWAAGASDRLI